METPIGSTPISLRGKAKRGPDHRGPNSVRTAGGGLLNRHDGVAGMTLAIGSGEFQFHPDVVSEGCRRRDRDLNQEDATSDPSVQFLSGGTGRGVYDPDWRHQGCVLRLTGRSRTQVTRLVSQYMKNSEVKQAVFMTYPRGFAPWI